jgi:hypothetical protein
MLRWTASLSLLLLACAAPAARAELVVLSDGHFFKVSHYELRGEKMQLDLTGGGSVTLPIGRIERVVDDEVVPRPVQMEEADKGLGAEPAEPALGLAFVQTHAVPETPYGSLIFQASRRHGLNPALVAAVVRAESAFDPRAVSHKGARGLMQLMPATAQRFGVRRSELFEPARNLEAGTRYLKWLVERYGEDLPRILAAYNAGEGAVERYGGVPPYRETRNYIRRIYSTLALPLVSAL